MENVPFVFALDLCIKAVSESVTVHGGAGRSVKQMKYR